MIYDALLELENIYNKRKKILKEKIVSNVDIEEIIINNSIITESNDQLNNYIKNYNNSINTKELSFVELENAKNEYVCIFDSPTYIEKVKLLVEDFVYTDNTTSQFKVLFQTETGDFITKNMLPYYFFGKYIESIKFNEGQRTSLFSSNKTSLIKCYYQNKLLKNENIILGFTDSGKIEFNTNQKMDKITVEYIPVGSEYIKNINALINTVKIKTDIKIDSNKINIKII